MAFEMPFDDEFGNHYPQSHWRVGFIAVSLPDRSARAELHGYRDAAAYAAGKHRIGQRSYSVSGEEFAALMGQYQGESFDLFAMAYQVAQDTKDADGPPDGEGNPTKISFFENASTV